MATATLSAARVRSEVYFEWNDKNELSVTIDTERLHIRSVQSTENEYGNYAGMYGDADVMKMLATGVTRDKAYIQDRIDNVWVKKWKNNIPYSGLAVLKNNSDDFLGHVSLMPEDEPGQAELSYLFKKTCWRQGFGTEAVAAVVQDYVPQTINRGYKIGGKSLTTLNATVHIDNGFSERILKSVGMNYVFTEEKHGSFRNFYVLNTAQLMPKKKCKCTIL